MDLSYLDVDRIAEAQISLEKAKSLDPTNLDVYKHLEPIYRSIGANDEAEDCLRIIASLDHNCGIEIAV